MTPERWQQINDVFQSIVDLAPEQRTAFLDKACTTDQTLRSEVESLLVSDGQEWKLIDQTALEVAAPLLADDEPQLAPGQTIGHYRIVGLLGRGGMGEVFLAQDESLARRVAIKLLPNTLTQHEDRIRRFRHEARAASAISHPNVAHVYEIGEVNGSLFTAMEFVDGSTLRDRLSHQTLRLGEAIDIARQVGSALEAAHAEGIVHRDIKPENIIVRQDGLVKVVDFGLAKLSEPSRVSGNLDSHETEPGMRYTRTMHTQPGMLMGTANYMSPEQARGREVDARTDIWSWGVVLYEMLAGQPPFQGMTNSDIIAEILKTEPSWLQTGAPGLPECATLILRKALNKDLATRCRGMTELLTEVRKLRRQLQTGGLLDLTLPLGKDAEASAAQSGRRSSGIPGNGVRFDDEAVIASLSTVQVEPSFVRENPRSNPAVWFINGVKRTRLRSRLFFGGAILLLTLAVVLYGLTVHRTIAPPLRPPRITQLTTDGHVGDAAISADGRLLAYVSIEAGRQSVWIRNVDSSDKWQLLPPDLATYGGLRFTPNGQSLFYVAQQPSSTIGILYRISLRGGQSQKVAFNIEAAPAVSPDGMQIAFIRSYPGQHRDALVIANVDGSAEREIISRQHPDKFCFAGSSWSPDSKLIALGASRNTQTEFTVMGIPVNGGTPIELTPWQWAGLGGMSWANNGRGLFFCARAATGLPMQVWRLSYPEGATQRITDDGNEYEEITLAQNALVATQTNEISNIWFANNSGAPKRITTGDREGADGLTVTSNGRIVYARGRNEQSKLWSINLDGSEAKLLTDESGFLPSATRDGRLIAYVSLEHGAHHVWLIDGDGGNKRQLTDSGGETSPSITPDGSWVTYLSLAKARGTLWKTPITGGPPVQLTHDSIALRPVVSPDGQKIACLYRTDEADKWKIAVVPIAGGAPLQTFALPDPYHQVIRWAPDSKALTYLDTQDGVQNVWLRPLDGSQAKQLTNFSEGQIFRYAFIGREQLVLARGGRMGDVALIRGLE